MKSSIRILRKSLVFVYRNIVLPAKHFILFVFTTPRVVAVLSAVLVIAILAVLDYFFFISRAETNWMTFIASVHGIFLDSVIFCLVGIALFGFRDRRVRIERYCEELEDFRFANSREAIIRKESIIRRLSRLKAKIPEMKGIVLTGANLTDLRLDGALLAGSRIESVDFTNARLDHSKFNEYTAGTNGDGGLVSEKAVCTKAVFRGAALCDADLRGLDLQELDFEKAALKRSKIDFANLRKSNFRFADFEETACKESDFRGADLYESVFKGANLSNALFGPSDETEHDTRLCAKLAHAHMAKSNLREATLNYTDMSHADLSGAILFKAKMKNVNLGWARLADAYLREADLEGADFVETDLTGADLFRANLRGAKNLTIEQLERVKSLYLAGIDPELVDKITKKGLAHILTGKKKGA